MAKSYTELANEVEGLKIWREEAERIADEMSQWIKRCGDLERKLEAQEQSQARIWAPYEITQLEDRILDLEITNKELEHKLGQERDKAMYNAEQYGQLEDKYTAALAAKRWADRELESWRKGQVPPSVIEINKMRQSMQMAQAELEDMRIENNRLVKNQMDMFNRKRKLEEMNEHLKTQERQCVAWNKELREEVRELTTRALRLQSIILEH